MKATRRLIAGLVVLAGLGYASTALGDIFDAGHIFHPSAPQANEGGGKNGQAIPDPPADNACDVAHLQARLQQMLAQKKALRHDFLEARKKFKAAKAHHDSHAKVAHFKDIMDRLRKRMKQLDNRISNMRALINRCQPGAAPPPDADELQDLGDEDAVGDEPGSKDDAMKISCKVPTGAETRSVLFRNVGDKLIPSGTPVTWSVKAAKQSGQFALPRSLAVGAELTAAELLKLGVPGDAKCSSRL